MATSTIIGKNISYRGGVVKFFGVEGRQDDSVLKAIEGELLSFSPEQLNRLAQIHVGPPSAGALYCSGIITISNLKRARGTDNERIIIPDVKIKEHCVDLVVKKYLGCAINYTNTVGFEIGLL
jgi:hypothetical protein